VYAEALRQIQGVQDVGYDTVWLTEHHFAEDGYSPSVMPIAGAVAARTQRVRIGGYLALTSFNNAIRFAEDAATAACCAADGSTWRCAWATPRTSSPASVPQSQRRSRYLEFIEVIRGLRSKEHFSYQEHGRIDNARLVPKPVQHPHPPIWAAMDRAAAAGGFAGDELVQQVPSVVELRAEFEARAASDEPMLFEPIVGSPETVGNRLERAVSARRHTHLMLSLQLPSLDPAPAQRSMELFLKEIKPQLEAAAVR
jgi:alkanesulfonate monooxygenase SsuD/methylene tetrahydromethanopterin reductase-like flavin-dependent oxidoreductase (luciferase family)